MRKSVLIATIVALFGTIFIINTPVLAAAKKAADPKTEKKVQNAVMVSSKNFDQPFPYHIIAGNIYTNTKLTKTVGNAKKFAKSTWYADMQATIDRSAQGSGNSVFYHVTSGNGAYSGWVWHGNLGQITDKNFNVAMKGSNQFKRQKIVALGDSITNGYDGSENLVGMSFPNWVAKYLNTSVTNLGSNGSYVGTEPGKSVTGDLDTITNNTDLSKYTVATIMYGTNDYGHGTNSLDTVKQSLQTSIKSLQQKYPKLKIYGILPIARYDNNVNSDAVPGIANYSMDQLRDAEADVYQQLNVPHFDWRDESKPLITDKNYRYRLYDQRLHPSARTYQMMGSKISKFMIANYK